MSCISCSELSARKWWTVAWAAGNGDRWENGDYIYGKRRLREIDRRIRFLSTRLESVEVVNGRRRARYIRSSLGPAVCFVDRDCLLAHGVGGTNC
jgi:transcription elongation factor GreB